MKLEDWELRFARQLWHGHPGVWSGDELSLGERAADRMRNSMGSWTMRPSGG